MQRLFTVTMCAMGALVLSNLSNEALAASETKSTAFAVPGAALVRVDCATQCGDTDDPPPVVTTVGVDKFNPSLGELEKVIIEYVPAESTFDWETRWSQELAGCGFGAVGKIKSLDIPEVPDKSASESDGCNNPGPLPGGGSMAGSFTLPDSIEGQWTITDDLCRFIGIGLIDFEVSLDVSASLSLISGTGDAGVDGFFNGFIFVTYVFDETNPNGNDCQ